MEVRPSDWQQKDTLGRNNWQFFIVKQDNDWGYKETTDKELETALNPLIGINNIDGIVYDNFASWPPTRKRPAIDK